MGYKKETWDSILAILGISISLFFPLIKKNACFFVSPTKWMGRVSNPWSFFGENKP